MAPQTIFTVLLLPEILNKEKRVNVAVIVPPTFAPKAEMPLIHSQNIKTAVISSGIVLSSVLYRSIKRAEPVIRETYKNSHVFVSIP